MPELPEVEVVIRSLKKVLIGYIITDVKIFYEPVIGKISDFNQIINHKILNLTRRGKYLIFFLSDDLVIVGHLRMEGKLYLKNIDEPITKHEHFILCFQNFLSLRFHDFRKFGRFRVYHKSNYLQKSKLEQLGLEPFDISDIQLKNILKNKKTAIKNSLLNQKIISGLGNIYVNEVLFLSKIHPARHSCTLNLVDIKNIIQHAKNIFNKSILLGGTTISTFESLNIKGSFQKELLVHGREHQNCFFCNSLIMKMKINNRGTYYCLKCQPK